MGFSHLSLLGLIMANSIFIEPIPTDPARSSIEARVTVGNSDIVDMLLASFLESKNAQRRAFDDQLAVLAGRSNDLIFQVSDRLTELAYDSVKDVLKGLFSSLDVLTGREFRIFPSDEDLFSFLECRDFSVAFQDIKRSRRRDWYQKEAVLALAGVFNERGSFDGATDEDIVPGWEAPPPFVNWHYLIIVELFKDRFNRTLLHEILGTRQNALQIPDSFFKVEVPVDLHPLILELRAIEIERAALNLSIDQLHNLVYDQDSLRLKISAKLTESLLAEAGFSVEIERLWSSMSVSVEDAVRLALPLADS